MFEERNKEGMPMRLKAGRGWGAAAVFGILDKLLEGQGQMRQRMYGK